MLTEIRPDIFLLKIPMPNTSLDHLNSYIIRNGSGALIIDTGLNDPMCMQAFRDGVKELEVDFAKADLFITHLHGDHFGLVPDLAPLVNRILLSRSEVELLRNWQGWQPLTGFARNHGFSDDVIAQVLEHLPYHHTRINKAPNQVLVDDGFKLTVGNYQFSALQTSGHAHGHMCLHEPSQKMLIAGDHILAHITPSLQCWSERRNPLEDYLKSLDRVEKLPLDLVLPGHQSLITDHRRRISEIKVHHESRCKEILDMLANTALTGFEIASRMTWDIDRDHWDDFPNAQKWFAFGEAMAHLIYLEGRGLLRRTDDGHPYYFNPAGNGPEGRIIH